MRNNISTYIVNIIISISAVVALCIISFPQVSFAVSNAPVFGNDFGKHLTTDSSTTKKDSVFNPSTLKISANNSLQQNIYNLFSPTNNSSVLWNIIKIITI